QIDREVVRDVTIDGGAPLLLSPLRREADALRVEIDRAVYVEEHLVELHLPPELVRGAPAATEEALDLTSEVGAQADQLAQRLPPDRVDVVVLLRRERERHGEIDETGARPRVVERLDEEAEGLSEAGERR